jgi:DNA-binding protein H-NS
MQLNRRDNSQAEENMVAERFDFTSMSVDELWSLHEEISAMLSSRILEEKRELEKRLAILNRGAGAIRDTAATPASSGKPRRAYPVVVPRYRNPETSETWSGRGKLPRWLATAMKAGRAMDEFLIGAPPPVQATAKTKDARR